MGDTVGSDVVGLEVMGLSLGDNVISFGENVGSDVIGLMLGDNVISLGATIGKMHSPFCPPLGYAFSNECAKH